MTRDDFGLNPDTENFLTSPLPGCCSSAEPAQHWSAPYRAQDGHVRTAPLDGDGQADYDQARCTDTCGACRDARDHLATADPSWYRAVLVVLARDYPDVCDAVWSTAVLENALRQTGIKLKDDGDTPPPVMGGGSQMIS